MGTEEAQQALVKYDVRSLPFVQLVATRRNATASSLPSSSHSFSTSLRRSSQSTFPLPLFLLIFVARRCIHHVHRYAIAYNVLDTFCRRSIDSIDSIEGPEKDPLVGPIKTMLQLTAATEKRSGCLRECPRTPSTFRTVHYVVIWKICSYLRVTLY